MRIGLIGCENSHAESFAEIFNKDKRFAHFEVTAVGGDDRAANERLRAAYGIREIYDDAEEMADHVDCAMIVARDGRRHAAQAMPFLRRGLPCFVDKPFCTDREEAESVIGFARKHGALLCGGSSLRLIAEVRRLKEFAAKNAKGGFVSAPILMDSEYGGFYFYASHLTEMSLEIFGADPISVSARRIGNDVTAIVSYREFAVCNRFCDHAMNSYFGLAIGAEGNATESISIVPALREGLEKETEEFVTMVESGKMPRSYERLIFPVRYMNAVQSAYETEKEIAL